MLVPAGLQPLPDPTASDAGPAKWSKGDRARRWHEAIVNDNRAQPNAAPEYSKDLYPDLPEWKPEANGCPYGGCEKSNEDVPPGSRAEHVFQHYKDAQYDQLWKLFGDTHGLTECTWEGCDFKVEDPKGFARHLDEHCSHADHCGVVSESGVCGHPFREDEDGPAHLERHHGLIAAPDDPPEVLAYCQMCCHWVKGRQQIGDHFANDLPSIMDNRGWRPRLLPSAAALG